MTLKPFSSTIEALLNIQYVTSPLKMIMKQSIIRMLQYGNEFFVKYQFNILSNGFFIYYHLQFGCKISTNIAIKQIFLNLFCFFNKNPYLCRQLTNE